MKQVKRILLIAITTVFAGLFFSANASAAATEINSSAEFNSALANGGDIILNTDITVDNNRAIANPLTLDLNGHTVNTGEYTLVVRSDLIIKDSVGSGSIAGNGSESFVFQIGSSAVQSTGKITLESGLITNNIGYGIQVRDGELIVNGGKIYATEFAVINWGKTTINEGVIEAAVPDTRDAVVRNGGDNSSIEMNGGKVIAQGAGVGIANSPNTETWVGSSLVVNGGEISAINTNGSAVTAFKNCSVTINGGTLISDSTALISNGSESGNSSGMNAKFVITGGNVISNSAPAIYAPQINGETTISGGTIRGLSSAIEIRAGKLTVTGGTLIAESTTFEVHSNASGTTTTGAAVAIAQHNTRRPILTHICGGTFRAIVPLSVANPEMNGDESIALVSVNIDQPCGELVFESTGDSSIYVESSMLDAVRGGIFTYSVADFLEEDYGERMTDDGRYEVLPIYTLRTRTTYGGGITVSKKKAFAGETIDIETDADLAFELKSLSATGNNTGTQAQIQNDTFTMPAENVTVAASFGFIPSPDPQPENLPDPTPGPATIPAEQQNAKPSAIVTVKKKDGVTPITPEEPNKSDDVETPNTYDGIALYIVIVTICGTGLLAVVPKPRKN